MFCPKRNRLTLALQVRKGVLMKLVNHALCRSSVLALMTVALPLAGGAATAAGQGALPASTMDAIAAGSEILGALSENPLLVSMQQNMQSMTLLSLHQANNREIMLAKLAIKRAENKDVRRYAQMMIKHHSQVNKELKSAVAIDKVPLFSEGSSGAAMVMDDMEKFLAQLSLLSDADFDRAYMNTMIALHIKNIAQLSGSRMMLADSATKRLVDKVLPQLINHLVMAKNIQEKMTYDALFN